MSEQKFLVFVYGTLRTGERNHDILKNAELVSHQSWTTGELYDTGNGYPAMVTHPRNRVYGELYRVTAEQLGRINLLEGYAGPAKDHHYDRVMRTIYTDSGEYQAIVYVYSVEQAHRLVKIGSGDWKCHLHLNRPELLYFAYGSCMDDQRFKEADVDHLFQDVVGRGVLTGYSLAFTKKSAEGGKADIVEGGATVEGKVYRIDQQALEYLYGREGVNSGVYRPVFVDVEIDGKKAADVLTFTVVNKEEETAPPNWYLEEILRGGSDIVSECYLLDLKERATALIKQ